MTDELNFNLDSSDLFTFSLEQAIIVPCYSPRKKRILVKHSELPWSLTVGIRRKRLNEPVMTPISYHKKDTISIQIT